MRILVVDDEPQLRRALERALKLEGYEVELATDGDEAPFAVWGYGGLVRPTEASASEMSV